MIGAHGRPHRELAYVLTTNQNYDKFTWFDVYRDQQGVIALWVGVVLWFLGVPLVLVALPVIYTAWRFTMRALVLAPGTREEGARHAVVVFASEGFFHRAEYIRGKGEVVSVLVDGHGPIPATVTGQSMAVFENARWGDQSTPDQPRQLVRAVRTYRRRPKSFLPVVWYPRTSTGYACHALGIDNASIRTPKQLADFVENAGTPDDVAGPALQGA